LKGKIKAMIAITINQLVFKTLIMEQEYKKTLLKTAVASIISDGHIDEREIDALKEIEKKSPYFSEQDLSQELESLLNKANENCNLFINDTIEDIRRSKLSIIEELAILEICLTIIESDEIIEKSEEEFIIKIRAELKVDDFILSRRFGSISYLGIVNEKNSFEDHDKNDLTEDNNS